jgi:predicted dehydrogenase
MGKLKVGVLGLIHDHIWANLQNFETIENAEVTCVADINEPLLEQARKIGIKKTYKTYDDLLSKEDLDAVLVYTENGRAADVIEKAAERGLHVMTEKPMAATSEQAQRMYNAAEKNGIRLMVNYPTTWSPAIKYAVQLAKEGAIGHIYQVWRRTGHKGPKEIGCSPYFYNWLFDEKANGAGAYIDFCCYGVNICRSILGIAEKATALGGTYVRDYLKVDDNAVLLLGYKKAMGVLEGTWSQIGGGGPIQYQFVIRGSEGTIAVNQDVQVFQEEKNSWKGINPPPLKEGNQNGPQHFVRCILEDKPFEDTVSAKFNVEVQAMLEAGLISMRENRTVFLKELI